MSEPSIEQLFEMASEWLAKDHPNINLDAVTASSTDESLVGKYLDPVEYCEKVLKIKSLTETQKKIMRLVYTAPYYKVLVPSGHTTGKCIARRQWLTLANGKRVRAEDLVGKSFDLITISPTGEYVQVQAKAEWNRYEPVYRVVTETGKRIVRNGEHPLWAAKAKFQCGQRPQIDELGWTHIKQLDPGMLVAVADELPAFGEKTITDVEAKVIAYLIGDGGLTSTTPKFTQVDGPQLDEFRNCVGQLGCVCKRTKHDHITYSVKGTERKACVDKNGSPNRYQYNQVAALMRKHGLMGKHSRDKFVPAEMFEQDRATIALFLSRLYSTDGWASGSEIGLGTTSRKLARHVQQLLQRFGIHARLQKKRCYQYDPPYISYVVYINDFDNVNKFAEHIGIFGKEKALAAVVASKKQSRAQWRTHIRGKRAAPFGCRWEKVAEITQLPNEMTVAVEVPKYHTFLTEFYEHNTFLAACLVNWWFDTFRNAIVLTTAPTERQVKDLLWKEVRDQRARAGLGGFIGPREPRMERSAKWFAQGFTARDENSFQGHHGPHVLIIFDEAQGIAAPFWEALRSMLTGGRWAFLAIYNPVNPSCRVFKEESSPGYHPPVRMSCLDHPNIAAELAGLPPIIPEAIRLADLKLMLQDWATPIEAKDAAPDDVFLDGQWWQLGPIGDARIAGRWPRQAVNSVWTPFLFNECCSRKMVDGGKLQMGVDVARYGDDDTVIFVRKGGVALHWEKHNGWNTMQTAERAFGLCNEYWAKYKTEIPRGPKTIPVAVDDTGVGGGVTDYGRQKGFSFIPINSSWSVEALEEKYDNLRSALWFGVVDLARKGNISLAKLPKHAQDILRDECCTQKYELDSRARRVVWPKKKMKQETNGHSPDSADAMNLAYLDLSHMHEKVAGQLNVPTARF